MPPVGIGDSRSPIGKAADEVPDLCHASRDRKSSEADERAERGIGLGLVHNKDVQWAGGCALRWRKRTSGSPSAVMPMVKFTWLR
jgi:hypothetical protein